MKKLFSVAIIAIVCLASASAQSLTAFHGSLQPEGFIQNNGFLMDQNGKLNPDVKFIYAEGEGRLQLRSNGFSYELFQSSPVAENLPESGFRDEDDEESFRAQQAVNTAFNRIDVMLKHANPSPEIIVEEKGGTIFTFYSGASGNQKAVPVSCFKRVIYKNIYPGIDLVFNYSNEKGRKIEYDFVVHPGADAGKIEMEYKGASGFALKGDDAITMATPLGHVEENELNSYTQEDGIPVASKFQLRGNTVTFNVGAHHGKTLVIDPQIIWGTYYGGDGSEDWDTETEITLDAAGCPVITGSTTSKNYIATSGAFQGSCKGSRDIFLAKFKADGSALQWATYMGGAKSDCAYGVCVNHANDIIITGFTQSSDFPTTSDAEQSKLSGNSDVVIAKFTPTGGLIWCTLLGGPDDGDIENGRSVICDANNFLYLGGYITSSSNISTTGAYQTTYGSGANGDAFVAKYSSSGKKKWATYLSGNGRDRTHTVCLDNAGNIYATGTVESTSDFASTGAPQTVKGGGSDAFLAKFDTTGHTRYWCTYAGGSSSEHGRSVVVDQQGNPYICGWTPSSNFPVTNGTQMSQGNAASDGFLVKYNSSGVLQWSTFFGGPGTDQFFNMTINSQDELFLCGLSSSKTSIATSGAYQSANAGSQDGFLVKMDGNANLIWGTYLGGTGSDQIYDMAIDASGYIFLDCHTTGTMMTTSGAYQTTKRGTDELVIYKYDPSNVNSLPVGTCDDQFEPNETLADAKKIGCTDDLGAYGYNGAISSATDADWFKFQVTSDKPNIEILLAELPKDYNLNLYNKQQVLINSSANAGQDDEVIIMNNLAAGIYYVEVAHDASEFDEANCYRYVVYASAATFSDPVGLRMNADDVLPAELFTFGPNPASSFVRVNINSAQEGMATLRLVDLLNRTLVEEVLPVNEGSVIRQISLNNIPAGTYLLQFTQGDQMQAKKLVVTR